MHREIQIKQFPIVTTHWWPKTRNERFVWENEQYLYRFLPLVHNHVQVIWVHTHPVCDVCVRALWLVGVNAWRRACLKRGADATFQAPTEASDRLMQIPNPDHATPEKYVIGCCNYDDASDTPSVKRWRRRPVWMQREPERAHTHVTHTSHTHTHTSHTHTHTSHTGCVCALRSLGHGCVQEVKKRYKYCWFSHTSRSFRVLGHQCVVTMGNCLIWISLCMFFFPLIETVTYTCHYMTDRLERFDL